ncbi:MAG: hypothetical protein EOM52_11375 [Clostridia bacterium]|nr:hypothetical protein [Clostridia bacterium]
MSGIEDRKDEVMALLAWRLSRFTGLDSTSVRVERAQAILDSTLFTLEMGERAVPAAAEGVIVDGEIPLRVLFELGQRRIDAMLKTVRQLRRSVVRTMLPTDNECYRDTLIDGMAAFFRVYEPEFGADLIHITCDYPLYLPVEGRQGVNFIKTYLDHALQENRFCAYFPPKSLHTVWKRAGAGNPESICNLFSPVFLSALVCVLVRESPAGLTPSPQGVSGLQHALRAMGRTQAEEVTAQACDVLVKGLSIQKSTLKAYLEQAAHKAAAELFLAADRGTLPQALDLF